MGPGFSFGKSVLGGLVTTFRLRKGKANASLQVSNNTFTPIGDVKKFKVRCALEVTEGRATHASATWRSHVVPFTQLHQAPGTRRSHAAGAATSRLFLTSPPTLCHAQDVVGQLDYKVTSNVTANTKYELGPKKYQVGATWDGKVANKVTQVKGWYTNKDNLVAGEATVSLNSKQKANVTFNQQKVSSGTGPALRVLVCSLADTNPLRFAACILCTAAADCQVHHQQGHVHR